MARQQGGRLPPTAEAPDGAAAAEVPSPSTALVDYLQHLQGRIQPLTQAAAHLPGPSDLAFHRSLDRRLADDLDTTKASLVSTLGKLVLQLPSGSLPDGAKGKSRANAAEHGGESGETALAAADLVDEGSFARSLGDIIDTLLENTDTCLDEYQGKVAPRPAARLAHTSAGPSSAPSAAISTSGPLVPSLLNANIRPLPQERFSKKPDNSRTTPWKHSLALKPHAKVPLTWRAPSLDSEGSAQQVGTRQGMYCAEGDPRENPYFYEITNFKTPSSALEPPSLEDLKEPPPLEPESPSGGPVPFLWVHNEVTFQTLYDHLMEERVKEVAIDVEHHNYRTFQGLVCLVQVSTRWQDFIIDGLSPTIRDISHKLNNVFANEEIVKILHGAEHDILWLQRDLNIYIVGLFDTYHATNVLNFPQHSLAYLLQRYIKFVADKRYQLADWRIRPLPAAMLFYARSDTHSLIHIYDCMRFEISQAVGINRIEEVFELSKRTAAKTYAKEEWDSTGDTREGWRTLWKRLGGDEALGVDARWERGGVDGLTKSERLFRALHDWRDRIARTEDESPRFILSSAHMLNLASRAPTTQEAVLPCIGPAFKRRSGELAQLIAIQTKAFEAVCAENAAIQRELLMQQNGTTNDELGVPVGRAASREIPLWPTEEASSSSAGGRLGSGLATMLFGDGATLNMARSHNSVTSKKDIVRKSLFAPATKAATSQTLLQSIRADLRSALRGVFGQGRGTQAQDAQMQLDVENPDAQDVKEESRQGEAAHSAQPVESVETFSLPESKPSVHSESKNGAEASDDGDIGDVVQNVRRGKKKDKKGRQTSKTGEGGDSDAATPAPSTSSENGKKRRWTKEEKEARKAARVQAGDGESGSLASSSLKPYDYSTSVSVLDAKPSSDAGDVANGDRKKKGRNIGGERSDKKDRNAASGSAPAAKTPGSRARYGNVPVGRDRREQAGGKSMTFSG